MPKTPSQGREKGGDQSEKKNSGRDTRNLLLLPTQPTTCPHKMEISRIQFFVQAASNELRSSGEKAFGRAKKNSRRAFHLWQGRDCKTTICVEKRPSVPPRVCSRTTDKERPKRTEWGIRRKGSTFSNWSRPSPKYKTKRATWTNREIVKRP